MRNEHQNDADYANIALANSSNRSLTIQDENLKKRESK